MRDDDTIFFDLPVRPGGPRKPKVISDSVAYAKEAHERGMSNGEAAVYAYDRVRKELLTYEAYQVGISTSS